MKSTRKALNSKIRQAIENLDSISGSYYEAVTLVNQLSNDERLSVSDKAKLDLALSKLGNFDPSIHVSQALNLVSSTDRAKNMANNPVPNDAEVNDFIEILMKKVKGDDLGDIDNRTELTLLKWSH